MKLLSSAYKIGKHGRPDGERAAVVNCKSARLGNGGKGDSDKRGGDGGLHGGELSSSKQGGAVVECCPNPG